MNDFRVSAPGKLMIAGEYSVLGPGGEALALAVSPGVEAQCTVSERWTLARADNQAKWVEGQGIPEDLKFAHAALVAAKEAFGPLEPMSITTDTEMGTGRAKPGLGGSASATVAVCAAVQFAAQGEINPNTLIPVALRAHSETQGGRGSGYDIATIAMGGMVRWRPALLAGVGSLSGEAQRIQIPTNLHCVAGYTGQSASTTKLIDRVKDRAEQDRARMAAQLAALAQPVGHTIDALLSGETSVFLDGLLACQAALATWDAQNQLGIVTPAVGEMIAIAEALGVVAKVSGAGGGDSVIAFSESADCLELVTSSWTEAGFVPLPIRIVHGGVKTL